MKNSETVNWNLLLDGGRQTMNLIRGWAVGSTTTRDVSNGLANSEFSGQFRRLVRAHGTTYGRRLARKALRYRGVSI